MARGDVPVSENLAAEMRRSLESRTDVSYEILSSPESRAELKQRMQEIIEGAHDRGIKAIVFLDKSARPLSWYLREKWKKDYPGQDMPDVRFVNIGMPTGEHAGSTLPTEEIMKLQELPLHRSSPKSVTREDLDDRLAASVEANQWFDSDEVRKFFPYVFTEEGKQGTREYLADMPPEKRELYERFMAMPARLREIYGDQFDGKKLLILDDVTSRGYTQLGAHGVFADAYPSAEVFSTALARARNLAQTKHALPWYGVKGASGVMEMVDQDLLSASITPERIAETKAKIEGQRQALNEAALQLFSDWEELVKVVGPNAVPSDLRAAGEALQTLRQEFNRQGMGMLDDEQCESMYLRSSEFYSAMQKLMHRNPSRELEERYYELISRHLDFQFHKLDQLLKLNREVRDLQMPADELLARAKQLRAEMVKLASE